MSNIGGKGEIPQDEQQQIVTEFTEMKETDPDNIFNLIGFNQETPKTQ